MSTLKPNKQYKLNNNLIAHITNIKLNEGGSYPVKGKVLDKNGVTIFKSSWTLGGFFINNNQTNNFDIKRKL